MRTKRMFFALLLAAMMIFAQGAMAVTAVVDNGAKLTDRLNMRERPSRDARAIAKFYSGTEVEVLSDAGDGFSQVRIGTGRGVMTGYMMTAYLSVVRQPGMVPAHEATYAAQVTSPYGTPSVVLRDQASNSFGAVAMLSVGESVRVLGTAGEYLVVRTAQGLVGYLAAEEIRR